ncbi:hypothetical protein SAMN00120144_4237 [Hymenobacter roseosalivarius DSM 11622]|uniref:Secreted protein n=1 Tax=Hymenobacter roseosalivarius DSM 11622 TaxID=645990 RepID=A0A1W1UHY2_9BACT|nr:DUF6660 family protein [Hymenobacter roseosalivarius]SMB80431.1 hypothetical protein SAMN00120144_4237 [Hymenobacter roseosalivarius DSM 11622]
MRLLSLFFAFYFACLSTMTCTDEVAGCQVQTQTTVAASSHSDCGSDVLGDWCSPLCQCHCCGGVVISPAHPVPAEYPRPVEWASAATHGRLIVAAPNRVAGAVWQPPQA